MRLRFVWQVALAMAAFAAPLFAQSGGYEPRPKTVTIRPTWADDLDGGLKAAGADPAPVLVLFVADKYATSRIQARLDARDSGRPEARTLKNMGYARLVLSKDELKKAQKRGDGGSDNAALAVRFGVKSLPAAVVLDNHGNLLFAVKSMSKLNSGSGLLKTAKVAQKSIKKIVDQIEKSYHLGAKYLKAGNPGAARRSFTTAAKYAGYPLAEKARAEIEKLPEN